MRKIFSCRRKNILMLKHWKIKKGQPLTLTLKLTHESTLLFYNSFYLLAVVGYQLKYIYTVWQVVYI